MTRKEILTHATKIQKLKLEIEEEEKSIKTIKEFAEVVKDREQIDFKASVPDLTSSPENVLDSDGSLIIPDAESGDGLASMFSGICSIPSSKPKSKKIAFSTSLDQQHTMMFLQYLMDYHYTRQQHLEGLLFRSIKVIGKLVE